jgi:hypothetical protein
MIVSNFDFTKTAAQWYQARTTALWQWKGYAQDQLALHAAYLHRNQLPGAEDKEHVKDAWDQVCFIPAQ